MLDSNDLLGIILAAIASFVIAWVWFSPVMFGKIMMKHANCTEAEKKAGVSQKGMWKYLVLEFVITLLIVVGLTLINTLNFANIYLLAFLAWVGFMLPVQMSECIWNKQPWVIFLINTAYRLVSLMVMAVILAKFL